MGLGALPGGGVEQSFLHQRFRIRRRRRRRRNGRHASIRCPWWRVARSGRTSRGRCYVANGAGNLGARRGQRCCPDSRDRYRFTTDGTTVGTTLEAAYLLSPSRPDRVARLNTLDAPVRAPVTLTWNAVSANNCIASGGVSGDGWAGPRPDSGQITVTTNVVGTAQYAMTCTAGPLSSEADMSVLYTAAPPAVRLTATPLQTQVRKDVTLAWSSEGADSCVATGGRPGDGWTVRSPQSGRRQSVAIHRARWSMEFVAPRVGSPAMMRPQ